MGSIEALPDAQRRILFVDAFDSFTNNIIGMLEQCLNAQVTMVHIDNDAVDKHLTDILATFDAVVVGPGPGHPANPTDVGFIKKLWNLDEAHMIPIFGICLGFQSLCHSHGAQVVKLQRPRHGIVSEATHKGNDIFSGIGVFSATQYHSLHVRIPRPGETADSEAQVFWEPSPDCPSLEPLAWDDNDPLNGPILMSVRHKTKPFWGVQCHPESICTSEAGKDLIVNWWNQASAWIAQRGHRQTANDIKRIPNAFANVDSPVTKDLVAQHGLSHLTQELREVSEADGIFLRWGKHAASGVTPPQMLEALGLTKQEVVMLDSQDHPTGLYSIIGLVIPGKTMKITYRVSSKTLQYGFSEGAMTEAHLGSIDELWPMLQEVLTMHKPRDQQQHAFGTATPRSESSSSSASSSSRTGMDGFLDAHLPKKSPFWGGMMGYISYEAGLETIDVPLHESCKGEGVPDVNFAFVHRSIVFDHANQHVYVQSLLPGDWKWILEVGGTINALASRAQLSKKSAAEALAPKEIQERRTLHEMLSSSSIQRPTEADYRSKVLRCQEFLSSGDSYELCLTDESKIEVPLRGNMARKNGGVDAWALYKQLRRNNPSPFAAFLRLGDVKVVGSSPERFLSWSRDGHCQYRPIKGTVKKGPSMTRELAHEILGSSKERAENLMIVDLIRHDLSGVVGGANTWVSKLMVVEEYETVYQLVSVIEGQLPHQPMVDEVDETPVPTGIDVLKASLPPGSMTGAPKKRSCEILTDIEKRPRGVYSGVLGYMDVGGAGDFSVVIRTAVTEGSSSIEGTETWRVGAGGAVTIQSTDEGEFLEMETKASSVLGALFKHDLKDTV